MFLLVLAHPGSPGQTAIKRSLLLSFLVRNGKQMTAGSRYLAVVKMLPLTLPNVDAATKRGIHHAITPSVLSANVCIHGDTKTMPLNIVTCNMHTSGQGNV